MGSSRWVRDVERDCMRIENRTGKWNSVYLWVLLAAVYCGSALTSLRLVADRGSLENVSPSLCMPHSNTVVCRLLQSFLIVPTRLRRLASTTRFLSRPTRSWAYQQDAGRASWLGLRGTKKYNSYHIRQAIVVAQRCTDVPLQGYNRCIVIFSTNSENGLCHRVSSDNRLGGTLGTWRMLSDKVHATALGFLVMRCYMYLRMPSYKRHERRLTSAIACYRVMYYLQGSEGLSNSCH